MAFLAQEKRLELLLDDNNFNSNLVEWESGRLSQVLTNSVGNSIKFTHQGSTIMTVSDQTHVTTAIKYCIEFCTEDQVLKFIKKKY